MATLTAVKSGNFNDPTVWDLGYVPGTGDTAKPASYTITITADVTCGLLDGTGQNGYFTCSTSGITINANVQAGDVTLLRFSHTSGECTVNGTVTGGSGSSAYGVSNSSTGTVNVTTATGGSGNSAHGIRNEPSGTVNVTTAIGGSGNSAYGIRNEASGTVNVTTATGGSGNSAYGAQNNSTGTVNVTTAIGGSGGGAYGIRNEASGTVNVTTAIGGSGNSAYGAQNNSTGTLRCKRAIGNNYGPGGPHSNSIPGVYGNNTVGQVVTVDEIEFGPYGAQPVTGAVLLLDKSTNEAQFRLALAGATKTLLDATASCDYPAESDVRNGVEYDNGDMIGTCAVPAPEYVAYGVAVDDTVGTALLTPDAAAQAVWEYATRTLTSLSTSEIADAVWNRTTRTLTQTAAEIEAAVSGSELTIYRGDTWSATLTGLGDISGREKLWFTLKLSVIVPDSDALVQITESDGLVRLNGQAGTAVWGRLTVDDEESGVVTIELSAQATAELSPAAGLRYDLQVKLPSGIVTLTQANAVVEADVTRAVS